MMYECISGKSVPGVWSEDSHSTAVSFEALREKIAVVDIAANPWLQLVSMMTADIVNETLKNKTRQTNMQKGRKLVCEELADWEGTSALLQQLVTARLEFKMWVLDVPAGLRWNCCAIC